MHQQSMFQVDDIDKVKIDFSLCEEKKKPFYYKFNIIPWQKLNNTTFFIVEDTAGMGKISLHHAAIHSRYLGIDPANKQLDDKVK